MGDIENKTDEWSGKVKETVGDVTDNEDLQAEGAFDQAKAKAKQGLEDAKDAGEAVEDKVQDAFDR